MTPSETNGSADIEALAPLRAGEIAAAEAGDVEALPAEMVGQVEIEEDLVSDGVTVDGALACDRGRFSARSHLIPS